MNYCNIKDCDIANGTGVRVSLFVSGCRNHCPNCFQPQTWDFKYGNTLTTNVLNGIYDSLNKDYISGLSILGGEPLEPENQITIYKIIHFIKTNFPDKTIWIYTGFTWEELHSDTCRAFTPIIKYILYDIDVLVDGRFIEDLKDIRLKFRGSSNQRIIDVQRTLNTNNIILMDI